MADEANATPLKSHLEALLGDLKIFLDRNPGAQLQQRPNGIVVANPWRDPSLILLVSREERELIGALNNVYLPPRHSALWHTDSKDLEFIYTAYPLSNSSKTRSFRFQFGGEEHTCEFGPSSDRLMLIALASRPVQPPSDTGHRNLRSFSDYHYSKKLHPESEVAREGDPLSFWIRDIDYEENQIVEFARTLNFYMSYFDPMSPRILVHRPEPSAETNFKNPFAAPSLFPEVIRARPIDSYLLSLWESSRSAADPFRRFIYLYQSLEYCAFYHVQEDVLRVIRRAVMAPDSPSRINQIARQVFDAVVEDRMQEPAKFAAGVDRCVDPNRVWAAIQPNAALFSHEVSFDGGFVLPALINSGWSAGDFCRAFSPKFSDSVRKIRNALVHAREARQVGIIAPTHENYEKLAPWLPPLQIAAMDAMMFGADT